MGKTAKAFRSRAVHIDLFDIEYDSTYIHMFPGGLPLSNACKVCHSKLVPYEHSIFKYV